MFCANCGKNNKEGAKFCLACGKRLEAKKEEVPANEPVYAEATQIEPAPIPQPQIQIPPQSEHDTLVTGQNYEEDYGNDYYNQGDEYAPISEYDTVNAETNEGTKYWIIVGVLAFVAIVLGAVLGIILFTSF